MKPRGTRLSQFQLKNIIDTISKYWGQEKTTAGHLIRHIYWCENKIDMLEDEVRTLRQLSNQKEQPKAYMPTLTQPKKEDAFIPVYQDRGQRLYETLSNEASMATHLKMYGHEKTNALIEEANIWAAEKNLNPILKMS